jgi:hypothetical protein
MNLKRAVEPSTLLGFMVSGFHGFMVSGFQGFRVSSGSGSLSGSGSIVSWFQGFIQIGIGIAIAIGIDCFTTEHNRLTVLQPHSLTASQPLRLRASPASQYVKTQCLRGFARILPVQLLPLGFKD